MLLKRGGGVTVMKYRASSKLGIRRSRLGWLSVRFDGGPFYPEMLDSLQQAVIDFGGLVRRGESLTAIEWLQRIEDAGGCATPVQLLAIEVLMWDSELDAVYEVTEPKAEAPEGGCAEAFERRYQRLAGEI